VPPAQGNRRAASSLISPLSVAKQERRPVLRRQGRDLFLEDAAHLPARRALRRPGGRVDALGAGALPGSGTAA